MLMAKEIWNPQDLATLELGVVGKKWYCTWLSVDTCENLGNKDPVVFPFKAILR